MINPFSEKRIRLWFSNGCHLAHQGKNFKFLQWKFVPGRIWGGKNSSLNVNAGDYIASTGTDCQASAQMRSSQNTTICTRMYSALWNLAKVTSSWNMQNLLSFW